MLFPHLLTVGGNLATLNNGTTALFMQYDPYNPLGLPANTVRVRTSDGNAPTKILSTFYETATLVPGTTDVYDVYKSGDSFEYLLRASTNVTEVLGANTSNVTDMFCMFLECTSLTSVQLFDTSKVTNMQGMFFRCSSLPAVPLFDTSKVTNMLHMFYDSSSLTAVPLFDTSKVTNMYEMFAWCFNVQSGALALYQQASTQTTPPTDYIRCFQGCGGNTVNGVAELAQIPQSWGGSMLE